jgi:YcaO-like protein with predicted kinase domain
LDCLETLTTDRVSSSVPTGSVPGRTLKSYRRGTDRLVTPDETLARVQPLMSAMGITRVANVTGLDVIGVPVVMCCRPNSRGLSVAQGKGLTLSAAKASAVMEAIEGYHADHIVLPLKLGSFDELQYSHHLVDASRLSTGGSGPFFKDRRLLWLEGTELFSSQPIWVPYDVVHTDFTYDARLGRGMFDPSSNGLASGNHYLEAISHGICEVIERDSMALWEILSDDFRRTTRLDLTTVNDPDCRHILERLELAHLMVGLWETTTDIGLPAFTCSIVEDSKSSLDYLHGAGGRGCHPKREIALFRALTEAIQSRLTFIVGSRDDMFRSEYDRLRDPKTIQRARMPIVEEGEDRSFGDVPTFDKASFEEDIAVELSHLESIGIGQVVVVNLTKPEFGVPVVRVLIPSLEACVSVERYRPGERARAWAESHR